MTENQLLSLACCFDFEDASLVKPGEKVFIGAAVAGVFSRHQGMPGVLMEKPFAARKAQPHTGVEEVVPVVVSVEQSVFCADFT